MDRLSFENFADFIRRWASLPKSEQIFSHTQFERDLGITGDDGSDLLIATEQEFEIHLSSEEDGYRKTFALAPNEYLFTSEGGLIFELTTLFHTSSVRAFTAGELHSAVKRALDEKRRRIE